MKKKTKKKKVIFQNHHIIYKDGNKREVTRKIRKGAHQIITLIRRYKSLTDEEISTIMLECELRRKFNEKVR